jgi:hypothetical protein
MLLSVLYNKGALYWNSNLRNGPLTLPYTLVEQGG